MNPLSNLPIRWKIVVSFGLVLLIFGAGSLLTVRGVQRAGTDAEEAVGRGSDAVTVEQVLLYSEEQYRHVADFWINKNEGAIAEFDRVDAERSKLADKMAGMADTPEEKKLVDDYMKADDAFDKVFQEDLAPALRAMWAVDKKIAAGDTDPTLAAQRAAARDPANAAHAKAVEHLKAMTAAGHAVSDSLGEEMSAAGEAAVREAGAAARLASIAAIVGLVAAVLLGVLLGSGLTRAVGEVVRSLKDISEGEGDLTQRIPDRAKDETGDLARYFNGFVSNVQEVVKIAQESASGVAAAAQEVASSAQEASRGVEQVSTAAEEVARGATNQSEQLSQATDRVADVAKSVQQMGAGQAAVLSAVDAAGRSIAEMGGAVEQIRGVAGEVGSAAENARVAAEEGQGIAQQTNVGMVRIQSNANSAMEQVRGLAQRSEAIGEMVEVINDVAEQTNLLALNAAIEAARAGEHGKGFAVVADEVRKLAERAAQSSGQIASIVREVRSAIDEVVRLQDEGNAAALDGVALVEQSAAALNRITDAAKQAAVGVGRVREAAENAEKQMARVDQERAAIAEAAARVDELVTQAAEVTAQVSVMIEGVATISEESAAAAEQASAATEELTAGSEEIAAGAEEAAASAATLAEVVGRFRA